jgi:hypothetical protein
MIRVARELRKILGTKEVAARLPESELEEIEACALCHHFVVTVTLSASDGQLSRTGHFAH